MSPTERFLSISANYLLKHFDAIATFSPDGKRGEISDSDLNLLKDLLAAQEDILTAETAGRRLQESFSDIDKNQDQKLSKREIEDYTGALSGQHAANIRLKWDTVVDSLLNWLWEVALRATTDQKRERRSLRCSTGIERS